MNSGWLFRLSPPFLSGKKFNCLKGVVCPPRRFAWTLFPLWRQGRETGCFDNATERRQQPDGVLNAPNTGMNGGKIGSHVQGSAVHRGGFATGLLVNERNFQSYPSWGDGDWLVFGLWLVSCNKVTGLKEKWKVLLFHRSTLVWLQSCFSCCFSKPLLFIWCN